MSIFSEFRRSLNINEVNIPSITIIDIVDILIVSFLIYSLIAWIKETRAWTLFKGILVVFFFGLLALLLQLNTILWILQNTLSVALIAIIVIFQPEFRKALERLGKGRFLFFRIVSKDDDDGGCSPQAFEHIMNAVLAMSKKCTGALILIEREVPLGDFESTGIKIDSFVTQQLITNIFEHNTPLHDGAMIIKNNRISAASCFLPLTDMKLNMELGTRHRAGVGASELSDAFVIIVSEETGDVSVAVEGKLYRRKTVEEIKSMFYGTSRSAKQKKSFWKGRK